MWAAFLCPREMVRLHALVYDLRLPLLQRDDIVEMSFIMSFVTNLEVVAGDDVIIFP